MKHLIMGTAGHVDHGKTSLIKALTGFDCDTHPEEKKRGITINLGFSHFSIDNVSIGIVDVPGHKDFIHTMVSGASGIDFVVLVVACDSGVMPQTIEHLKIMEILGIKHGLVVLTKKDLVDDELLNMTILDVKDLVNSTFLKDSPIIPFSAKTLEGIDQVKKNLIKVSNNSKERIKGNHFRMFIDRIFSVKGFGTVVTGSVMSGEINKEDKVYVQPFSDESYRVRRLERHGEEVNKVIAGDRASINIKGFDKAFFKRGMIVSDKMMKETNMIDARLSLFSDAPRLGLWSQVTFHLGCYEHQAKIHLLDKDELQNNESCLVQIHLNFPCIIQYKDKFVIRNSSGEKTIGGGMVVDPFPLHHKRRTEKLLSKISKIGSGELEELLAHEIRKQFKPVSYKELKEILNIDDMDNKIIENFSKSGIKKYLINDNYVLITRDLEKRISKRIIALISNYHKKNPFDENGLTYSNVKNLLNYSLDSNIENFIQGLLSSLVESKKLKIKNNTYILNSHSNEIDDKMAAWIEFIETFLKKFDMQTPLYSEMLQTSINRGIKESDLMQMLNYLVKKRRIYKIDGNFIHSFVVDSCRDKLVNYLHQSDKGIKVSEFRDLVKGNRKICLLLLTQFDNEGLTKRDNDLRFLR